MSSPARRLVQWLSAPLGAALLAGLSGLVAMQCTPNPAPDKAAANSAPSSIDDHPAVDNRQVYRQQRSLMGTPFEIQLVADSPAKAADAIDAAFAEVARIEALISSWQSDSALSQLNQLRPTTPESVPSELAEVVARAQSISALSQGAFDITYAACSHLWSVRDERIPDEAAIADCLPRVDYRQIEVDRDEKTIAFANDHTQIGLGGIGKGYGIDGAAKILTRQGIDDFLVDGGGDLRIQGRRLDRPWSVALAHPRLPGQHLGSITVGDGALVTSGDYERYFERDGRRYHHIIDPTTGRPATASMAVTVIAADAATADALATALFVMGAEKGIALADSLADVEALIIDGDLQFHRTRHFRNHFRAASPPPAPTAQEVP